MEDASGRKIGVVVSRFNDDITEPMLEGALKTLSAWKVRAADTAVVYVSGSFEIPYGCLTLLKKKKFDALVAIGCIIKGETEHDRHLASAVSAGIMRLSLDYETPIAFGVITTNNLAQARARSFGSMNRGSKAAEAALESALLTPRKKRS